MITYLTHSFRMVTQISFQFLRATNVNGCKSKIVYTLNLMLNQFKTVTIDHNIFRFDSRLNPGDKPIFWEFNPIDQSFGVQCGEGLFHDVDIHELA